MAEQQIDTYPASLLKRDKRHREGETRDGGRREWETAKTEAKQEKNRTRETEKKRMSIKQQKHFVKVSLRKPSQDSHSAGDLRQKITLKQPRNTKLHMGQDRIICIPSTNH